MICVFLRHSFTALCTLLVTISFGPYVRAEKEKSFADQITITLDPHSSKVIEAEKQMHQVLEGLSQGKKPQVLVKNGAYILHGNLFCTGETYALMELPSSVGFALRTPEGWQLRGLWDISVAWRPKGWKPSENDYLPRTPSDKAFELMYLSDRRAPEVVIAGEVDRYFQGYYLLRFSPKDRMLHPIEWMMAKPDRCGPYVRLYSSSSPRSIWTEHQYSRWKGDNLVLVASWHDEVPYNENEGGPFIEAEIAKADGKPEKYRIINTENNSDHETSYAVTCDGKPYAEITFIWPKPPAYEDNPYEIENAWLFSKLTGLPRDCFPYEEGAGKHPDFEKVGKVRITGSPEAIPHLSGKPAKNIAPSRTP